MNEYYNGDNDNDVCDMDKMAVFSSNTNCWKLMNKAYGHLC